MEVRESFLEGALQVQELLALPTQPDCAALAMLEVRHLIQYDLQQFELSIRSTRCDTRDILHRRTLTKLFSLKESKNLLDNCLLSNNESQSTQSL